MSAAVSEGFSSFYRPSTPTHSHRIHDNEMLLGDCVQREMNFNFSRHTVDIKGEKKKTFFTLCAQMCEKRERVSERKFLHFDRITITYSER